MTHGEETGPETHQDSAVLTYLEGLLMHPVGPGATATRRSEADVREPANHGTRGVQLHGSNPSERDIPTGATSQHLKKARLLRSEAWREVSSQRVQTNGQDKELNKTSLDGSAQGESTLLASLLQSFSSRLQTVAMSQCVTQSHKELEEDGREATQSDNGTLQGYCPASSRLKGLMRKKHQSYNTVPYSRRNSQPRRAESPRSFQNSADDAVSCAERLKAVASLVKNRSSPAPSPKPTVACSQLALLLSSEAHLQQYSREQALKAQLCGRSASERLAAMATQQTVHKRPPSLGESVIVPDMLSSYNAFNGTLPSPSINSCDRSPSSNLGQSVSASSPWHASQPAKEKRSFDRQNSRPPQNCSSLLLLLLNNHNSQKHLTRNGHLDDDCSAPPSQASSHQSDSEYSNLDNSLTKDSSDAESCYSSCSPIDLSIRRKVSSQKLEPHSSASSLDKLTETLINNWKPETPGPKVPATLEQSPDMKSHHKVTLMQLLLDRRNTEKVNKMGDHPALQLDSNVTVGPLGSVEESKPQQSFKQLMGGAAFTSSISEDTSKTPSPYSYSSPVLQSSPLDLCKSKPYADEKRLEPSFTASKLLQDLAHCGLLNKSPSPQLQPQAPSKIQSPHTDPHRPQTLLDRLVAPVKRTRTPLNEPPPATFTPFAKEKSPPGSTQIENLLERRTVLQLLLGNSSHKEKSSERKSTEEARGTPVGTPVIRDNPSGLSLNINVKTEPGEERLHSYSSDDETRHRQVPTPHAEAHNHINDEQYLTDPVAKYGLLSQLLKQKTTTYHSSPGPQPVASTMKEEQKDCQVPLPKKRKLCLELAEHLSKELCQRPLETAGEHLAPARRTPETPSARPLSVMEKDSFTKGPASNVPVRDGQGFNVLKRLLLSDNCLKELTPPHGTAGPLPTQANCKANGNISQPAYNHELVNLPWFPQTLNSGPGNLRPLASSPRHSTQGSPWVKGSPKPSPKHVKMEMEASPRWLPAGEGTHECGSESPPLTRSNPILYYMLQRNNQLRKELDDNGPRTHCGVRVKTEPCSDERYYEGRLSAISPGHVLRQGDGNGHINASLGKP